MGLTSAAAGRAAAPGIPQHRLAAAIAGAASPRALHGILQEHAGSLTAAHVRAMLLRLRGIMAQARGDSGGRDTSGTRGSSLRLRMTHAALGTPSSPHAAASTGSNGGDLAAARTSEAPMALSPQQRYGLVLELKALLLRRQRDGDPHPLAGPSASRLDAMRGLGGYAEARRAPVRQNYREPDLPLPPPPPPPAPLYELVGTVHRMAKVRQRPSTSYILSACLGFRVTAATPLPPLYGPLPPQRNIKPRSTLQQTMNCVLCSQEGRQPSVAHLASILDGCALQMGRLQPRQVSSLAWSLAKLGRAPPEAWARALCRHALATSGTKRVVLQEEQGFSRKLHAGPFETTCSPFVPSRCPMTLSYAP